MRYVAEKVQKTITKDSKGNVLKGETSYSFEKNIALLSPILPYGQSNAEKDYGFSVSSTHRTFSYDDIKPNDFLRDASGVYHVLQVAVYPKIRAIVMEKI